MILTISEVEHLTACAGRVDCEPRHVMGVALSVLNAIAMHLEAGGDLLVRHADGSCEPMMMQSIVMNEDGVDVVWTLDHLREIYQ